ncbi:competence protein CoiA [Kitasatospora sp. NPDC018058]|uniref:competence protein CoiA n=1 Tax=Kitasatospora sp. NPDC018058 TaxID=3364025 RepID=UPI0037C176B6
MPATATRAAFIHALPDNPHPLLRFVPPPYERDPVRILSIRTQVGAVGSLRHPPSGPAAPRSAGSTGRRAGRTVGAAAGRGRRGAVTFTAVHAERGRLDATRDDLGCGWAWTAVHRARPRVPLGCPECGHGVHAKVSPTGMRFFSHDRGSPACALAQESMEHYLTKLQLAHAIRAAGWYAELEVRAPDGSWRADVMASSADGARRTAWEAQLSPITRDEFRERTARYAAAGIAVCWVALSSRSWVGAAPTVVVSARGPASTEN